jgi:phosphoribosylpyrophosphate synthetase
VRHIVTTDSVPSAAGAQLQVVSVAPLLAGAVKRLAAKE